MRKRWAVDGEGAHSERDRQPDRQTEVEEVVKRDRQTDRQIE